MAFIWNSGRYFKLAKQVLEGGRLPLLLHAVSRKKGSSSLRSVKQDVQMMMGLCAAWWRGEYRGISRSALLAVVAGLVYLVMPLDMVPDWLPGAGFLDDLAVLTWVLNKFSHELQAYRQWRSGRSAQQLQVLEAIPEKGAAQQVF